jgi:hypothetical protein
MSDKPKSAFGMRRLAEVLGVVILIVLGLAVLMPSLQMARYASKQAMYSMRSGEDEWGDDMDAPLAGSGVNIASQRALSGQVSRFVAQIDLTSQVSVGTAQPESIYEAQFHGTIYAREASASTGLDELRLPLPPQLISLSDLEVLLDGEPSEDVSVDGADLLWRGTLGPAERELDITYTAVGKGLFELRVPPGRIVEEFDVTLTANSSDLQMMELSLQPEEPERQGGKTIYRWHYEKLMLGRPIRVDVLGIAPMDRLSELVWLAPVSVLVFGMLVAVVALAYRPEMIDKWMLLLIVGAFAAAYPLMYYAQDFLSLWSAVVIACIVMLLVIGLRAMTLLGARVGLFGIVLPGGAVLTVTILATIFMNFQGLLLTAMTVGTLAVLMALLPRVQAQAQAAAEELPSAVSQDGDEA